VLELRYFSIVTATTFGYGDLVPSSNIFSEITGKSLELMLKHIWTGLTSNVTKRVPKVRAKHALLIPA